MADLVAVPSEQPGGLNAGVGAHFGHCELYTLVEVEDGKVGEARIIPNVPHVQGGCMAPVNYLANHGVRALVAGGMGQRPLMGFQQVGIDVFYGGDSRTVGEAVQNLLQGKLPRFGLAQTCGGGGEHECGGH